MSYDFTIVDGTSKTVVELDERHHLTGGTYCLGGTTRLTLNVTYNYCRFYYPLFDSERGIKILADMTMRDSIPLLEGAISKMSGEIDDDYWKPTEGNAKAALVNLVELARLAPEDAFWQIT